ncbi:hypothetical protein L195_g003438 [Trifolium pratense]|uniref:Uncharacterized protein n=1 Tax=Trifolium pratense TaxID=57577 RepID=A0A2K3NVA5_TRIPR|nr:hypothetical protein L195_g003438 [Trifolium pratense]
MALLPQLLTRTSESASSSFSAVAHKPPSWSTISSAEHVYLKAISLNMSPLLIVLNFLQCFVESREPNHVTIQPGANALGISGLSPQEASGQWCFRN